MLFKKIFALFAFLVICNMHADFKNFVILIIARNNQELCQKALASALAQDYPEESYSIIFCDDASSDATLSVVQEYITQNNKQDMVTVIPRAIKQGLIKNQYDLVHNHIDTDEIVVMLNPSESFAHAGVLSHLNDVFQSEKAWLTYRPVQAAHPGKVNRKYPQPPIRVSAFCAWLFKRNKPEDIMRDGALYTRAVDASVAELIPAKVRAHFVRSLPIYAPL